MPEAQTFTFDLRHAEYGDLSAAGEIVRTWEPETFDDREVPEWVTFALDYPDDAEWCTLVQWHGTTAELTTVFEALLADLRTTPTGDDTTYDYYPSGVRLAQQMAEVLGRWDDVSAAVHVALEGTGLDPEADLGLDV